MSPELFSTQNADSQNKGFRSKKMNAKKSAKVFIIHEYDEDIKISVAKFLADKGLYATDLNGELGHNETAIEVLENALEDGDYAVVLYSPCDESGLPCTADSAKVFPCQKTVFIHGYLVGRLGRGRVTALLSGGVEIPKELSGVQCAEYSNYSDWRGGLVESLKAAGFSIM